MFRGVIQNPITLLPNGDSTTVLQVYNAAGTATILSVDTLNKIVQIGSSITPDNIQVNLTLDSYNAYTDTAASCSTTANGSLYYNTVSNSIRACVSGGWEDLPSTGSLGIYLFGVVSDSSNAGTIADIAGSSGNANSPCKVYWSATQSVTVAPCVAYSGGRKVIVASTVLSTAAVAASAFSNICLDGTNNQPKLETANATESSAAVPAWNANNPVLCLATVKMTTTAGNVGNIWDIRTFTNTQKTFMSINAASALGVTVVSAATTNNVALPGAAAAINEKGILVARDPNNSATAPNAIIVTQGPQWVKSTGTSTINTYVQATNTSGYVATVVTAPATVWANLGLATRTIATSCSSNTTGLTDCQFSQFLNPLEIR